MSYTKTRNNNVYIFEENDNMTLVFDKYDLVSKVLQLYALMQVNVSSIHTGYTVTDEEKELVSYVMGGGSNCFAIKQNDRESMNPIDRVKLFLDATKTIRAITTLLTEPPSHTKHTVQLVPKPCVNTLDRPFKLKTMDDPFQGNIDEDGVKPVNDASDNYASVMDEIMTGENKVNSSTSICILYNSVYECALVCDVDKILHTLVKEFPEFQIVREYSGLSACKHAILKEYFAKNMYNELEVINKKLTAFENLYDITTQDPMEEQKAKIFCYIKHYYNISNNVEKRIKVSTLLEAVEQDLNLTNSNNLKYRFASILAELGLQKKRYSDGMYIYGIESKSMAKVETSDKDIQQYMSSHPRH